MVTLLVTMIALHFVHDSPVLMLSTCSILNALAAYVQYSYVSSPFCFVLFLICISNDFDTIYKTNTQLDSRVLSQLAADDDDDDDDDASV